MKLYRILYFIAAIVICSSCGYSQQAPMNVEGMPEVITDPDNYNELSSKEKNIILKEGTERAFTGKYYDTKKEGIYLCKQCNNPLFKSEDKFNSGSGWPAFDDIIEGGVEERTDDDGMRTEIICANCKGHLGHVFFNEGFTKKMTRHCANSASLQFFPLSEKKSN